MHKTGNTLNRLGPFRMTRRAAVALLVLVAGLFTTRAFAQEPGWIIVRADYGWRDQRNNVTDLVRDLVARGGVNGRVAVNNQTMGGDPAVGKDKSLHITGRNRRGEQRDFEFREGSAVDVTLFAARPDWDDRDDYRDRDRGRDGDRFEENNLRISAAYYGVQGQTSNVTDAVRRLVREARGEVRVNNANLGGDPAPGRDKVLIVIYSYRGVETACAVSEGNLLRLP